MKPRINLLTLYFLLSYLIAWGGVILVYLFFGAPQIVAVQNISLPVILVTMNMVHAPAIAGLISSYLSGRKRAIKEMFILLFRWRANLRQYLLALGVFPAIMLLVSLLLFFSFNSRTLNFLPLVGLLGFISSFIEEIGWTGFATPRLLKQYKPLTSALILGTIHALWHLLASYWGSGIYYGNYFWLNFLFTSIGIIFLRIYMIWLMCKTKSGLLTYLAHASWTGGQLALIPFTLSTSESTWWNLTFSVAVGLLTTLIIIKDQKMLFSHTKNEINLNRYEKPI